jgi:predicted nucleic acid-binding protein
MSGGWLREQKRPFCPRLAENKPKLSPAVRGNLVPDAWFAALAIESGCEWVMLDRDYTRVSGLNGLA